MPFGVGLSWGACLARQTMFQRSPVSSSLSSSLVVVSGVLLVVGGSGLLVLAIVFGVEVGVVLVGVVA